MPTLGSTYIGYGHFTIHPGHMVLTSAWLGRAGCCIDRDETNMPFTKAGCALGLLGIADAVLLLEADELNAAVSVLKPEVLVLGNEFKNNADIQTTLVKQRQQGGAVQFHAGDIHYATADLLSGSERDLRQQRRSLFQAACNRQRIEIAQLLDSISGWGSTRLIVLGDTIVDQYAACEAIGMSAEAPVWWYVNLSMHLLGAVPLQLTAWVLNDFVSVVGADSTAELA